MVSKLARTSWGFLPKSPLQSLFQNHGPTFFNSIKRPADDLGCHCHITHSSTIASWSNVYTLAELLHYHDFRLWHVKVYCRLEPIGYEVRTTAAIYVAISHLTAAKNKESGKNAVQLLLAGQKREVKVTGTKTVIAAENFRLGSQLLI
jgi:hypothetical protein